jgi:predicted phosphate transport protein (TIGR00153 family)
LRLRFLPEKADFFQGFSAMAVKLQEGAGMLNAMFAGDVPDHAKADEIRDAEDACDTLTHEIIQRLNRTFITPIDREDIHALARTLDDVMDSIDAAATLLPLYEIRSLRHGARELAAVIARQAEKLRLAIDALQHKGEINDRIREIHTLEHEADIIHREAVRQLFREERDPLAVMKWKEILDLLEAATDAAEAAADVIEGIVVKHA